MLKGTLSAATPETRVWIVLMQLVTVAYSPKTKTELVLPSASDHSFSHGELLEKKIYPSTILGLHWLEPLSLFFLLLKGENEQFVVGLIFLF